MDFELLNAGASLLPVVSDGLRAVVNRFTGGAGAEPANVEERIALVQADTERLEALAAMDRIGDTYSWVNAVRGLMRPAIATMLVVSYSGVAVVTGNPPPGLEDFAQMAAFYMFGERTLRYNRRN